MKNESAMMNALLDALPRSEKLAKAVKKTENKNERRKESTSNVRPDNGS